MWLHYLFYQYLDFSSSKTVRVCVSCLSLSSPLCVCVLSAYILPLRGSPTFWALLAHTVWFSVQRPILIDPVNINILAESERQNADPRH